MDKQEREITPQQRIGEAGVLLDEMKGRVKTPFFELGDDPHVVRELLEQSTELLALLSPLREKFSLDKVPLSVANGYFALTAAMGKLCADLEDIQESNRGSTKNTKAFIKQVSATKKALSPVDQLLQK
ncbi:MAG: hypothetical protein UY28_C0001G0045 [Candidatus Amesbacteria bacterium GW2011_GWB1_48_13]|uniref:Uncharacterized protein n=1 Tax=Candidatus Amesbacteria bacterium GW2011_GWB1_48_13 TaxID=1618362 RepID=A0A0G1XW05_9BACT|nr:MAG: hypothetical protein UY28_C0001G0045 [Candidatus Amesbacteria bacterium GW2011_GWB1_48_13]